LGISDLKSTAAGRGPFDCSGQLKHDLEGVVDVSHFLLAEVTDKVA
jgi:hypothetical protein